ncbi:MAG: DUF1559 domain-containing protein, partial [Pirellulaceae bacterium]|nr:DUF1559 domain-containing protein [Pirellulaceae bacterium]
DLSLLGHRHFTALVLDGEKLREYFRKRDFDLDQKLLGTAATSISLKKLKSIIVAFDDQMANGMMGGAAPTQGWFIQVDFTEETNADSWNRWLLGPGAAAGKKTAAGALLASDKSFAVQWRSGTQFVVATEDELKRIAMGTGSENSELAADILFNQNQALLYFTLRAQPLQQLVDQFSQMAAAFGGANAETEAMFAAIRSLDKIQLRADLQLEQMLHLQLSFHDLAAAKSVQSMVNQGIDQFVSQGGAMNLPLPSPGGNGAGLSQELRKLLTEIQAELTQGGVQSVVEDRTVNVTAARPRRLDDVIDQGFVGIAAAQAEVGKREKLRLLATALQKFYTAHGRYPAESASPLSYRRVDEVSAANTGASDTAAEPASETGPAFSWRVALLPHLGYDELYASFDFTQPWDSEANRKAAATMPVLFDYHNQPAAGPEAMHQTADGSPAQSDLQFLTGSMGAMGAAAISNVEQLTDGADRTLLIAQTPQRKTPWTSPGGWEVNSQQDLAQWQRNAPQPLPALMFSGRGIMVQRDTNLESLQGWVTPAGKERFNRKSLQDVTILPPLEKEQE